MPPAAVNPEHERKRPFAWRNIQVEVLRGAGLFTGLGSGDIFEIRMVFAPGWQFGDQEPDVRVSGAADFGFPGGCRVGLGNSSAEKQKKGEDGCGIHRRSIGVVVERFVHHFGWREIGCFLAAALLGLCFAARTLLSGWLLGCGLPRVSIRGSGRSHLDRDWIDSRDG
jgi:hypothetical protein